MRSLTKKIFLFSVALFIIASGVVATIGLSYSPEIPADVAVVLGNEVDSIGKPSDRLKARVNAAIELYKQGKIKTIIVSGGVGKSGFSEAAVMANYLKENQVPDQDVIIDEVGNNTMTTAVNTAKIAHEKNFKKIVVVSQYFHLPRCVLAFNKAGLTDISAAHPDYFELRDIPSTAREVAAIVKYSILGSEQLIK